MDSYTKKDIENISYEILKTSKSLDVFPTPVDRIIAYTELTINNGIDLSKIHPNYLSKTSDALKRALGKVKGIFDRKEKIIHLDLSLSDSKKNFVKLHEVGHGVLPWQQGVYEICEDDEDTLSAETREDFEIEANVFASITLFQCDRFYHEMNKLGLGIDSAIYLSKYFGASIHATLRKYVEDSKNRCALLVLKDKSTAGALLRDHFQSEKFTNTYGRLTIPYILDCFSWTFVQDYCYKRRHKSDGLVTIMTKNGLVDFRYHFFNNTYNAFVFIFPLGETKSTKTKFIITDNALNS